MERVRMIFVINNLKYDTDKMELISDKCIWKYSSTLRMLSTISFYSKDVKIYRSKKNRWLLVYVDDIDIIHAVALDEDKVKPLLLKYDLDVYERLFGELEEA